MKAEDKKISEEQFEDLISPEFIEQLVAGVNKWTRDVSTVINISQKFDLSDGTALQEINYWQSYERSLNMIEQQIKVPEVDATIMLLEAKNKYQITTAWKYDLNFEAALQKCLNCNAFTKDFPLNDLLSSNELDDLYNSIKNIFNHMKKITNFKEYYSIDRSFKLLGALSRDLNDQLIKILRYKKLILMPANEFIEVVEQSKKIFERWKSDMQEYRDHLKKHNLIKF